ncbi:MAG: cytochrome c [Campylobacterales bacterium]
MKKLYLLILFLSISLHADKLDGKKVFETYCWGCHHQTAMAFGPPFSEIASKRTKDEIKAYVISPKSMYKSFGYKRTVMTQLHLNDDELDAISNYVLKQKGK